MAQILSQGYTCDRFIVRRVTVNAMIKCPTLDIDSHHACWPCALLKRIDVRPANLRQREGTDPAAGDGHGAIVVSAGSWAADMPSE